MVKKYRPKAGERVKLRDTGNIAIITYVNKSWINNKYGVWEHQISEITNGFPEYDSLGVREVRGKNIEKMAMEN